MKNRSTLNVMWKLLGLVRPLTGWMIVAVVTGVLGFICASFITIIGAAALLNISGLGNSKLVDMGMVFAIMATFAVLRGVLHYIEHACNHYIAFKLLAIIRDKIFTVLRKLAPAKLDGVDKGNLIGLVTSDIELLEIFFAHTISPICIALVMAGIMVSFINIFHPILAGIAVVAYLFIGVVVPVLMSKATQEIGREHRDGNGELNNYVLDSLRGIKEVKQYAWGEERIQELKDKTEDMSLINEKLKLKVGTTTAITNTAILVSSIVMFIASSILYKHGGVSVHGVIIPTFAMFSSFGAFVALANLGVGLSQTIACGRRVLELLDEEPLVLDVVDGKTPEMDHITIENVNFSYEEEEILKDLSLEIESGKITGITGKSGCGKSTLLKLLMRFWDTNTGEIIIGKENIQEIDTKHLRKNQSLVTQDTHLFCDSIAQNLRIGKMDASQEELEEACKKASVHDFVMSLPQGYETKVGELGDTLSGGERQRLGLARAFLHDAKCMFLDEPTSNLDSLNEAVILQSLKADKERTVVLVSHRKSTMKVAKNVVNMESNRVS